MDTNVFLSILPSILVFIATIIASSGFWMFMMKKLEIKDLSKKLLVGLARDRIVYLSSKHIERGWIMQDEYENLCDYLYEPYREMGGNGVAKRLMDEVNKLPIRKDPVTKVSKMIDKGEKDEAGIVE